MTTPKPTPIKISITANAQRRAAEAGFDLDIRWWSAVAVAIVPRSPDRTYTANNGREHEVHGVAGGPVNLFVAIERKAKSIVFVTLWRDELDGDVNGPTWGHAHRRASEYVDGVWQRARAS
jgi:hypothetical protein